MKAATLTNYIELDEDGRAWVVGANTRVEQVVTNKLAWGWDADEIHRQYPHLTLAQIHAAFAYYYEHQDEIDRQTERSQRLVEKVFQNQPESPFEQRLRQRGPLD